MGAEPGPFKQCPVCGALWLDYRDFVTDPTLPVEGYQACLVSSEYGMVLLTHQAEGCGTTRGVRTGHLRVLYDGPE